MARHPFGAVRRVQRSLCVLPTLETLESRWCPATILPLSQFEPALGTSQLFQTQRTYRISDDLSASIYRSGLASSIWTAAEGRRDLGHLDPEVGGTWAVDLSADGTVVTGSSDVSPFRWTTEGGIQALGQVPGSEGPALGLLVSGDGRSIVVGTGGFSYSKPLYRWTADDGYSDIFTLPLDQIMDAYPSDISYNGNVIVGWMRIYYASSSYAEAFRWTSAGGMERLGQYPGGENWWSRAFAVSADGSVIVGTAAIDRDSHVATRWLADGTPQSLGTLSGGSWIGEAHAVSADGSVIVGTTFTDPGYEAWIWDATNGMRRLSDVLHDDYGLDLAGRVLRSADYVSADGRIIIGTGADRDHLPGFSPEEGWVVKLYDLDIALADPVIDQGTGEIKLSAQVTGSDLSGQVPVEIYWATGPRRSDVIKGLDPIRPQGLSLRQKGSYGPVTVTRNELGTPPKGATHLIVVADRNGKVVEDREDNNWKVIDPSGIRPMIEWTHEDAGIEFGYQSNFPELIRPATMALYWAASPSWDARLGMVNGTQQAVAPGSGPRVTFRAMAQQLGLPPAGATHVLVGIEDTSGRHQAASLALPDLAITEYAWNFSNDDKWDKDPGHSGGVVLKYQVQGELPRGTTVSLVWASREKLANLAPWEQSIAYSQEIDPKFSGEHVLNVYADQLKPPTISNVSHLVAVLDRPGESTPLGGIVERDETHNEAALAAGKRTVLDDAVELSPQGAKMQAYFRPLPKPGDNRLNALSMSLAKAICEVEAFNWIQWIDFSPFVNNVFEIYVPWKFVTFDQLKDEEGNVIEDKEGNVYKVASANATLVFDESPDGTVARSWVVLKDLNEDGKIDQEKEAIVLHEGKEFREVSARGVLDSPPQHGSETITLLAYHTIGDGGGSVISSQEAVPGGSFEPQDGLDFYLDRQFWEGDHTAKNRLYFDDKPNLSPRKGKWAPETLITSFTTGLVGVSSTNKLVQLPGSHIAFFWQSNATNILGHNLLGVIGLPDDFPIDSGGIVSARLDDLRSNEAPYLAPIDTRELTIGQPYSIPVVASDPDPGDRLTFSLTTDAPGMVINPSTGLITGTPPPGTNGAQYRVMVTVRDSAALPPGGATASTTFTVRVRERNAAPVLLVSEGPWRVRIGNRLRITLSGYDPDGPEQTRSLIFRLEAGAPEGMAIDADGWLTWTPQPGQTSTSVTIRVADTGTPSLSTVKTLRFLVDGDEPATPLTQVLGVRTTLKQKALSSIQVAFTGDLSPASVASSLAFVLASAGRDKRFNTRDDAVVQLRPGSYDSLTRTVTLVPRRRLVLNQSYQITIRGAYLIDRQNRAVDADRDGVPGGDQRTMITRALRRSIR
ncbi:MAG: putative Ig domain-containing protein [Isosphaeraceae bacterium]